MRQWSNGHMAINGPFFEAAHSMASSTPHLNTTCNYKFPVIEAVRMNIFFPHCFIFGKSILFDFLGKQLQLHQVTVPCSVLCLEPFCGTGPTCTGLEYSVCLVALHCTALVALVKTHWTHWRTTLSDGSHALKTQPMSSLKWKHFEYRTKHHKIREFPFLLNV